MNRNRVTTLADTRRHAARVYDVTICICITQNSCPSSTQNSSSQEPSPPSPYASPSPSFAFPSPLRLLLRADVSRHVSRVRLWEPIQPRFVNERRMNEASRPSGGCARVYRLLNLHFRRNARRAARRNDAAQRVGDAKITRGRIVYSFRLRNLSRIADS